MNSLGRLLSRLSDVTIFWDYDNMAIPSGVSASALVARLDELCRAESLVEPTIKVYVTESINERRRLELSECGVDIIDCPTHGKKNVADIRIVVDMMATGYEADPPSTIILISNDNDFAPAISKLAELDRVKIILISSNPHTRMRWLAHDLITWNNVVGNLPGYIPGSRRNRRADPTHLSLELNSISFALDDETDLNADQPPIPFHQYFYFIGLLMIFKTQGPISMDRLREELNKEGPLYADLGCASWEEYLERAKDAKLMMEMTPSWWFHDDFEQLYASYNQDPKVKAYISFWIDTIENGSDSKLGWWHSSTTGRGEQTFGGHIRI